MKKLLFFAAMMLTSIGAFAQGQFAIGAYGDMAFKSGETRFGVGVKAQYEFVENFRGELDLKFYPKKGVSTTWNPNINIQYVVPIVDKFNIYPILGVGILINKVKDDYIDDSQSAFVFHGGAGAEYFVSDKVKLNFDFIYQYGKKDGQAVSDQPIIALGAAYVF